jgi:exodeoxyribonuclease V alpha subunit
LVGPVSPRLIPTKKLVEKYSEGIFVVIETASLDGIRPKRQKRIKDAWAEQEIIWQIMVFLPITPHPT